MDLSYITVKSPIGPLTLMADSFALKEIRFGSVCPEGASRAVNPVLSQAARELEEYFAGRLRVFTVPAAPDGTDFQKRVWDALLRIPYGGTASYGFIAAQAGSPRAFRAAGQACHFNPIPVIIPCHRVLPSGGGLGGYAGGAGIKRMLLELEKEVSAKNMNGV